MEGITRTIKGTRGDLQATYLPITVDNVGPHQWKKNFDQAQIRQVVITHYPSARPNSSLVSNLFELEAFGIESAADHENVRVNWVTVPQGMSQQDVEEQLAKFKDATIYRIMADDVELVLSEEQLFAADSDEYPYTLDDARCNSIVMDVQESGIPCAISKYGELLPEAVEMDEKGNVITIKDENKLQYRATGFTRNFTADVDVRADMDATVEIIPVGENADVAKAL